MLVYVISSGSVFRPVASINRMLSLAKGLAEAGNTVKIFCHGPAGRENHDRISGSIDDIHYTHLGWRTGCNAHSLPGKAFHIVHSTLGGILMLIRTAPPDAILLLSTRIVHLSAYLMVAEMRSIPVFHERNEYPHHATKTILDRFYLRFYLRHIVPRFSGLALMTHALVTYFTETCPACPPILHLPMTVDSSRFLLSTMPPIADRYIAYCGTSFGDKDGVQILVKAYAHVANEFPDTKLVIIGSDSVHSAIDHLKHLIDDLDLESRVVLTGEISRGDIPAWLEHAELLALARPDNLQAAGGFPTKLGEYLSSARPVVVTRVGEIAEYLQDGVNAWIAEPGSVENYASRLRDALKANDADRNTIGLRGRDVALSVFNYSVQGRRLNRFMIDNI